MIDPHLVQSESARIKLREEFVALGFKDAGESLIGIIEWNDSDEQFRKNEVEIKFDENFPTEPPQVFFTKDHENYSELSLTFHIEISGSLCLYSRDIYYGADTWKSALNIVTRIKGWLQSNDSLWPEDTDCDMERYLPRSEAFVLYDSESLIKLNGPVKFRQTSRGYQILSIPHSLPPLNLKFRSPQQFKLVWIQDLGVIETPPNSWFVLKKLIGEQADCLEKHLMRGVLKFLVLIYQRGDSRAILIVETRVGTSNVELFACESADLSIATRNLRAKVSSDSLSDRSFAIIGCGAVGSYVADLLFRSGARRITLVDPQLLRPGNLVRHIAGDEFVGEYKVEACLQTLKRLGLPTNLISTKRLRVTNFTEVKGIVDSHDFLVDATGDNRITQLLIMASENYGNFLISVGLQREGQAIRLDRWPLEDDENHLGEIPLRTDPITRESGCGESVSLSPPTSVVLSAALVVRVIIDLIAGTKIFPPTILEILNSQLKFELREIGLDYRES